MPARRKRDPTLDIEILAPAGGMDALLAALNCGADAVYLGSMSLNARRNAKNFDDAGLADAAAACRERGVKAYIALNTIVYDGEEDDLLAVATRAARLGFDAAIVQDLGAARALRRAVPELALHASTQMAVHSVAGARFAKSIGISRVVLARELCRAEIAAICRDGGVEVEVFVHGSLCVSVSGQCYLSAFLGGRSGNRGLCAQPCRLPFRCRGDGCPNGETHADGGCGGMRAEGAERALSLKDLSLLDRVGDLAQIGVRALKIEGRMKSPEYVAAAVTALRLARDGEPYDAEELRAAFSRGGFTSGYFDARRDKAMFGFRTGGDAAASAAASGRLSRLASTPIHRTPLEGLFRAHVGSPVAFEVNDMDGHCVLIEADPPQAAATKPTECDEARRCLERTGGTHYRFSSLDIVLDGVAHCPASLMNSLRRSALDEISRLRREPPRKGTSETRAPSGAQAQISTQAQISSAKAASSAQAQISAQAPIKARGLQARREPRELGYAARKAIRCRLCAAQLSYELLTLCDSIVVPVDEAEAAMRAGAKPGSVIAGIPRMSFGRDDAIAKSLARARSLGVERAWAGNVGSLWLAKEAGLRICAGWTLNVANSEAAALLAEIGAEDVECSLEASARRAAALTADIPLGAVAHGTLPLMCFRNALSTGGAEAGQGQILVDRLGAEFPIWRAGHGVSELLNPVPLYMADRLDALDFASFYTLWFTRETAEACAAAALRYRQALDGLQKAASTKAVAEPKAVTSVSSAFTRGLYFRAAK